MMRSTQSPAVPPTADRQAERPALAIRGLTVRFPTPRGPVRAVSDLSLDVDPGEVLAIVGESGSGKSVTARAAMGLLRGAEVEAAALSLGGRDLQSLDAEGWRSVRGRSIGLVFQDALSALNPVLSIGDQVGELFRLHEGLSRAEARARAIDLLRQVRIPAPERRVDDHPHQFSGGMRQRILIAMAIALRPAVLIADEPTTALDVTVQSQILDLLDDLRRDLGMAVVLITHDLGVVARMADRVAVMYAGRVVETASAEALFAAPAHPYTRALLASVPRISARSDALRPIAGSPPNLVAVPSGCAFHPRCPARGPGCADTLPPAHVLTGGRTSACHFAEEVVDGRR